MRRALQEYQTRLLISPSHPQLLVLLHLLPKGRAFRDTRHTKVR